MQAIPDSHYAHKWRMLVARITAVSQEIQAGHQLSPEQRQRFERELLPRITVIRDLEKSNARGQLALEIDDAEACFYRIMGQHWRPRPDTPAAREVAQRGHRL
ncbi:hypothetical protein SEA_BAXTERFOX_84 [Gordonia phage BaxterFox]|uniref:Uncharacterized protein n=1 Tax=Gordonia phage BaxterFox TaxID=1821549 RepID=A0A142KCR1_9CAUD|nr:hypothetical protein SEA_BAXTERFOX_84 [Gordonia phage BaxterFox]AMS03894.1 hypothetical protein SEA_BAXTERFOX_84 [Gordonia phage BaxterFox]